MEITEPLDCWVALGDGSRLGFYVAARDFPGVGMSVDFPGMKKGYFVWKKPFIDAVGAACHMWLVVGLLRYTDEKCTVHRLQLNQKTTMVQNVDTSRGATSETAHG